MNWDSLSIDNLLERSIAEDIGSGDITSSILFTRPPRIKAEFVAKQNGVLAGLPLIPRIFKKIDPRCVTIIHASDGDHVSRGDKFVSVSGPATALLAGERLSLNFVQRLCGIATRTAWYCGKAAPVGIRILDTRKTTPLLRELEKYAVRMGGGTNHRSGLYDAVLVKDNHLMIEPDFAAIVRRFRSKGIPPEQVEIEITSLRMLKDAIQAGARWFLLDNMSPATIRKCIRLKTDGMSYEVSGGITTTNFRKYLIPGVDSISIGALTHSVESLDISLEFVK